MFVINVRMIPPVGEIQCDTYKEVYDSDEESFAHMRENLCIPTFPNTLDERLDIHDESSCFIRKSSS